LYTTFDKDIGYQVRFNIDNNNKALINLVQNFIIWRIPGQILTSEVVAGCEMTKEQQQQ